MPLRAFCSIVIFNIYHTFPCLWLPAVFRPEVEHVIGDTSHNQSLPVDSAEVDATGRFPQFLTSYKSLQKAMVKTSTLIIG